MAKSSLFDQIVQLDQGSEKPRHFNLEAEEKECLSLSERLGVEQVVQLNAVCTLSSVRGIRGYDLSGQIEAKLRQYCVVTLEPFEEQISEEFFVRFVASANAENDETPVRMTDVDPDEPDIEYFADNKINISEVIVQYLALGVDPYPRKKSLTNEELALFEASQVGGEIDEDRPNPFNVLKKLQDKT